MPCSLDCAHRADPNHRRAAGARRAHAPRGPCSQQARRAAARTLPRQPLRAPCCTRNRPAPRYAARQRQVASRSIASSTRPAGDCRASLGGRPRRRSSPTHGPPSALPPQARQRGVLRRAPAVPRPSPLAAFHQRERSRRAAERPVTATRSPGARAPAQHQRLAGRPTQRATVTASVGRAHDVASRDRGAGAPPSARRGISSSASRSLSPSAPRAQNKARRRARPSRRDPRARPRAPVADLARRGPAVRRRKWVASTIVSMDDANGRSPAVDDRGIVADGDLMCELSALSSRSCAATASGKVHRSASPLVSRSLSGGGRRCARDRDRSARARSAPGRQGGCESGNDASCQRRVQHDMVVVELSRNIAWAGPR